MPEGIERDNFKQLHKERAQKYSTYLTELFKCYGRIA
uniref:Transposase n=1 Tax=Heterorhabditis bacteriophora TaxID=37862 RepID=A0A1I7WKC5_HETBA